MKALVISLLACLCIGLTVAEAGDEKPWFDLENCGMCKGMSSIPGLMENMTWETHVISNGMMTFTMVDAEYAKAYAKAKKMMEATGKKMMEGEKVDLCGFCSSFGSLAMAGANIEAVETKGGEVMLMTSADEALVKKIQAHAETSIEEFAKMQEHDAHAGHNH